MSSSNDAPISNFETNTATFRRSSRSGHGARGAGDPPARLKRRVMDIEDALSWAYRDELPKGSTRTGETAAVSPMFSMVAFGARIDNWSREPGFPMAMGDPHPDALAIGAAVDRLARFAGQDIEAELDLGAGFALLGGDEALAMRRALASLVATVVRCAKLGHRPYWPSGCRPAPVTHALTGKPMVVRWEAVRSPALGGRTVEHEMLMPVEVRLKGVYPSGAHCPLKFSPSPQEVMNERAEYAAWWAALDTLAADLTGSLDSVAVLPPGAAQRPWLGDGEAARPPRVFDDLSAPVYKAQSRQTAEAYRALGVRRGFGARGRGTTPSFAPRRIRLGAAAAG